MCTRCPESPWQQSYSGLTVYPRASSGGPRAQNRPRGSKSIDFDVSGLALEGPGLKTDPGGLKASILTPASRAVYTPEVVPPPHVLSHPVVCVGVATPCAKDQYTSTTTTTTTYYLLLLTTTYYYVLLRYYYVLLRYYILRTTTYYYILLDQIWGGAGPPPWEQTYSGSDQVPGVVGKD